MLIEGFSRHIFWTYLDGTDLSPEVVIKQVIGYGEIADLILLSKSISREKILETMQNWKDQKRFTKRINFMQRIILA